MSEAQLRKRQVVIPVFVSHMGCPFECIFCDQRKISGQKEQMTVSKMTALVDMQLESIKPGTHTEIGFYGGSFTGIPQAFQRSLLEKAQEYLKAGKIQGIRLSTRPDYINSKSLSLVKSYGVSHIEIGAQSLDDEVLRLSCRGHSQADTLRAFDEIRTAGIKLGVQTMIGLPGDTADKAVASAVRIIGYRPETVRIYPTLVIKGTGLEKMYLSGQYKPLSLNEAVDLTALLLDLYNENGINVIRVGLQPTEELNEGAEIAAGPFHPAFRHLVESRIMRTKILQELGRRYPVMPDSITILVHTRNLSEAVGYKRENIEYFRETFRSTDIKIKPGTNLKPFEIELIE